MPNGDEEIVEPASAKSIFQYLILIIAIITRLSWPHERYSEWNDHIFLINELLCFINCAHQIIAKHATSQFFAE